MSQEVLGSQDRERLSPVKKILAPIQKIQDTYQKVPPELEALVGSGVAYIFLTALIAPHLIPQKAEAILATLDVSPSGNEFLRNQSLLFLGVSANGFRRIERKYFPFFKEYVNVFILNTMLMDLLKEKDHISKL